MGDQVRPVNPADPAEIRVVAERMRLTLVEVLGKERGEAMYTVDWLEARVRFHLDPEQCTGQVFVSVDKDGSLSGHTIVRLESEPEGTIVGLFSTIYLTARARGKGTAKSFVAAGEEWMRAHGMTGSVTYTHPENEPLKRLFGRLGYSCSPVDEDFVRLFKRL